MLSRVRLFATPWTVACQAPLYMGFSRREYWSGLPFPSPGDLPNQGIEPGFPTWQADSLPSEPPGKPYNFTVEYYSAMKKNEVMPLATTYMDLEIIMELPRWC